MEGKEKDYISKNTAKLILNFKLIEVRIIRGHFGRQALYYDSKEIGQYQTSLRGKEKGILYEALYEAFYMIWIT